MVEPAAPTAALFEEGTLSCCSESASLVLLLSFPFFLLTQLFFLSLISSTASFL